MDIVHTDDLSDPRLDDFVRLTDVALRRKLESRRGLYLAEGLKVIERSLAAGHCPRAVLLEERWLADILRLLDKYHRTDSGVTVFLTDSGQIKSITGYRIHRGAMASFERPCLPCTADFMCRIEDTAQKEKRRAKIFVLENLVDHTNVGAVFRSAAALGVDGILVTPSCADPLYRRSVKVSMGNVFHIPWTRIEKWPQEIKMLEERGWITASLALRADALSLRDFASLPEVCGPGAKIALILGTEGDGLSQTTIARSRYSVVIPMYDGVDSLNVAAAGALAAWELQ